MPLRITSPLGVPRPDGECTLAVRSIVGATAPLTGAASSPNERSHISDSNVSAGMLSADPVTADGN
jgi:hypothetical protein